MTKKEFKQAAKLKRLGKVLAIKIHYTVCKIIAVESLDDLLIRMKNDKKRMKLFKFKTNL